jgi:hypothetical protein
MDECFERGKRKASGRVDDGRPHSIPAPAGDPGALTVESAMPSLSDSPDANQL